MVHQAQIETGGVNQVKRPSQEVIECSSDEGITIGLIDSIIACANAIDGRNLDGIAIDEARRDLMSNLPLRELLCGKLHLMQSVYGQYTAAELASKLLRFPSNTPVIVSACEDYCGPAKVVSLEPQGYIIISDGDGAL